MHWQSRPLTSSASWQKLEPMALTTERSLSRCTSRQGEREIMPTFTEDAARMAQPTRMVTLKQRKKAAPPVRAKKVERNDPCPCGSGVKFKKCHGR